MECKHGLDARWCSVCNAPAPQPKSDKDQSFRQGWDGRYHSQSNGRNGGEQWEQWEDRLVLESDHDPSLSQRLGRTIRAIQNRRGKLLTR